MQLQMEAIATHMEVKKKDVCRHYKISFLNQAEYFSVKKDFRKKFDVRQTADDQI